MDDAKGERGSRGNGDGMMGVEACHHIMGVEMVAWGTRLSKVWRGDDRRWVVPAGGYDLCDASPPRCRGEGRSGGEGLQPVECAWLRRVGGRYSGVRDAEVPGVGRTRRERASKMERGGQTGSGLSAVCLRRVGFLGVKELRIGLMDVWRGGGPGTRQAMRGRQ